MDTDPRRPAAASAPGGEPLALARAYAALHNLILERPTITRFLQEVTDLTGQVFPGTHSWVVMFCKGEPVAVANREPVALRMAETVHLRTEAPALEAVRTGRAVEVHDLGAERRWSAFGDHARANGLRSGISLPLRVEDRSVGALNVYGPNQHLLDRSEVGRAQALTAQAGTALTILLRQARTQDLEHQLRAALSTRAVIDQALGILMYSGGMTARQALEVLRFSSQTSNRKLSRIAAELIVTATGHPPQPPRPLGQHD